MEVFIELLKMGVVGLVAGMFSAFMALRKYKYEKWWEMRVNAYKNVIENLSDLTAIYQRRNDTWENSPVEPAEIHHELERLRTEIRKHKDMGAFLFSPEAEKALIEVISFKVDYKEVYDPSDIYGPFSVVAKKGLAKIVELSKKDLAVKDSWL